MKVVSQQPTVKAPGDTFTGDAWYDVIARGEAPSRVRAEGTETEWGDQVTDAEYAAPPSSPGAAR